MTTLAAQLRCIALFANSSTTKKLETAETPKVLTLNDVIGAFK